jgi:uncharacterized membrane protein YdjX (TVP38/TMEM64 family)
MAPALRRGLILVAILLALISMGSTLRSALGIDLDVDSVRTFAQGLGPLAPVLFVGVVALRGFLALPSQVVLIAAGLCFGTLVGAVVGGTGLMLSGLGIFLGARYAGRASLEATLGERFRELLDVSSGWAGSVAIALGSGYPIAPLSPIHATAGLTLMSIPLFVAGALAGGIIRASIFSYFGNAIIEEGTRGLLLGTAGLLFVVAVPFAFPSGRRWLARLFGRA